MVKTIFNLLKRKLLIKVMVIILPLLLLIIFSCMTLIVIMNEQNNNTGDISTGNINVSAQVLAWKPQIEKYAKQFGISQYENLIFALIQQESGGTSADVMQSSEGAYNTKYPGGITDPDYSIYCGVQELKEALTKAGVKNPNDLKNISLALQTYNFGEGFLDIAKSKGGYSLNVAQAFSSM
jgi:soluble lytic murein transglycosylase-like protein